MKKTLNTCNPHKIGDILYTISGYDMTLVDFYEVVRTTPCKVELRELKQEETYDGFLCGTTMPKAGEYAENSDFKPGQLFKVREDGGVVVPYWPGCSSYNIATRWNGKPKYFNHCD